MLTMAELLGSTSFIVIGLFVAAIPHIKVCAAPYDAMWYYKVGLAIVVITWFGLTRKLTDAVKLTSAGNP
jgi:hypothetical protein